MNTHVLEKGIPDVCAAQIDDAVMMIGIKHFLPTQWLEIESGQLFYGQNWPRMKQFKIMAWYGIWQMFKQDSSRWKWGLFEAAVRCSELNANMPPLPVSWYLASF